MHIKNVFKKIKSCLKQYALNFILVFLLAISAQCNIPFKPVPVTLQNFVITIIALLFGPHRAVKIVGTYLFLGWLGAPVFAKFSSGASILFGPTSGYLWSFLIQAWVVGTLANRGFNKTFLKTLFCASLGFVINIIIGVTVLCFFKPLRVALMVGGYNLLPGAIIKLFVITLLTPTLLRLKNKARTQDNLSILRT